MAQDDETNWCDDDRDYSSSRDSDDSPLLSHRIPTGRAYRYPTEHTRSVETSRSTLSLLMKFFLFCAAMISFCLLLYIPVYNWANHQVAKALVTGWSTNTNRDTKLYVLPDNVTTLHEPKTICPAQDKNKKNKLLLLIIVCSATENFERRVAIRNTWGDYTKYKQLSKLYNKVREKYKNYNYTYDLYDVNVSDSRSPGFARLLPELAKALQSNIDLKAENVTEENRFEDDNEPVLPEFDMNKDIAENEIDYDYNYESNIMRIPPKGYENNNNLDRVLNLLRNDKNFNKFREKLDSDSGNTDVDFKLAFLLGLPSNRNDTEVSEKIANEIEKYGDIIQEDFIDSYNNLTLKSIMMLKWITNKCNESVRYILKTDDDMYINVPNLISNLRNKSREFDNQVAKGYTGKEYLLMGDLICGARPVLDSSNKWFSPRYMYGGRVYPKYLSGTGYLFTAPAALALYNAALKTPYFHLEDIYITGLCASRASPRVLPRDEATFTYASSRDPCAAHVRVTSHRVTPQRMQHIHQQLATPALIDACEKLRLTQVRREKLKPKTPPKRVNKIKQ